MSSRLTRWSPTTEQIMILEEMYQKGLRSPNTSQIQMLTAHLSLYGKIEGKNVFYWFQNHKARDRQKLRKKLNKQMHHHHHHHRHQLLSGPTADDELPPLHPHHPSPAQPHRRHHSHSSPQPQPFPSSSIGYLLQATVEEEEDDDDDAFQLLPTSVNSHPRKMDLPQHSDHQTTAAATVESSSSSCMMRTTIMSGRDCILRMATGPTTDTTPLKTLQLFPTSSTNLKDICDAC